MTPQILRFVGVSKGQIVRSRAVEGLRSCRNQQARIELQIISLDEAEDVSFRSQSLLALSDNCLGEGILPPFRYQLIESLNRMKKKVWLKAVTSTIVAHKDTLRGVSLFVDQLFLSWRASTLKERTYLYPALAALVGRGHQHSWAVASQFVGACCPLKIPDRRLHRDFDLRGCELVSRQVHPQQRVPADLSSGRALQLDGPQAVLQIGRLPSVANQRGSSVDHIPLQAAPRDLRGCGGAANGSRERGH